MFGQWQYYKKLSRIVSASLSNGLDSKDPLRRRAAAIYQCAEEIVVARAPGKQAVFAGSICCRDRVCPLCEWRLTAVRARQLTEALKYALAQGDYDVWMVCLTIRNCSTAELAGAIDTLIKGWSRLRRQQIARSWSGACRALEVTYNAREKTWHPHLHALVVAPRGACGGVRRALSTAWGKACGLDYEPVVYFAPARTERSAGYEVGKSSTIPAAAAAYIAGCKGDDVAAQHAAMRLPEYTQTLARVMRRVRTIAYSGALADARRALGQEDEVSEVANEDVAEKIALFDWESVLRYAYNAAKGEYEVVENYGKG